MVAMATFHWQDNLSSTAFTPRDFQVELLAAASEKNIIICLGHNSSKEFIALKLILEKSHELRSQNGHHKKVTLVLTATPTGGESMFNLIHHLTDLKVVNLNMEDSKSDWKSSQQNHQVVIVDMVKCWHFVRSGCLDFAQINLVIIEDCHKNYSMEFYQLTNCIKKSKLMPKVLGLAGPLHSAGCPSEELPYNLEYLERVMGCKAETASDIVTVLR